MFFLKTLIRPLLLSLAACCLLPSAGFTQKLAFTPKFTAGERFHFRQTENSTMQIGPIADEPEAPPTISSEQKITDYAYHVVAVRPDQSVALEMRITRIYQRETGEEGVTEFDSDRPDTTDLKQKMLSRMIGRTFRFTLSPQGKVSSFTGMDAVWDDMQAEMARESPIAANVFKNMKRQFGDEAMGELQSEIWGFRPARKVKIGQTWKRDYVMGMFGLYGKYVYTLREYDGNNARIDFNCAFASDKENPFVWDLEFVQIRYNLAGKATGQLHTGLSEGLPRRTEYTLTMSGPMEVKTVFSDWTEVPMSATMHIVMERIE